LRIRNKIGIKKSTNYNERLKNTMIFANASFNGEVKLLHEVNNNKTVAVYVPKDYSEGDKK